jgi:hypothetical protein
MTTETPVETITESLGRLLLSLRQHQVLQSTCRPSAVDHPPLAGRFSNRIDTLGNGQMLLPGIAEPRLWSFNSTL